jgi:hypothetical protein
MDRPFHQTLRFYSACIRQTVKDTLAFFDLTRLLSWVKLVVPVAILVGAKFVFAGTIEALHEVSTILWTVTALLVWGVFVAIVFAVRSPVVIHSNGLIAVDRLKAQVDQMRDQMTPRLEILFELTAPFVQNPGRYPLFRIGVRNTSNTTALHGVRVLIDDLLPPYMQFLPLVLRQMHDNPPQGTPFRDHFDLPPGDTKYIDVVRFISINNVFHAEIQHITPGVAQTLPAGQHTFNLKVRAMDSPPIEAAFAIDDARSEMSRRPAP